ncbi:MAG: hypothetical protein NVS2B14_01000 [Chamaesiphon sp.]
MSISTRAKKSFESTQEVTRQVIDYISGAVARIFGPRDDNYPATGVQPFEGDPADRQKF